MSEYSSSVRKWAGDTVRDFGYRLPPGFRLDFSQGLSDDQIEQNAETLYQMTRKNGSYSGRSQAHSDPVDEMLYLVPHMSGDGSVTYVDRHSGRVVAGIMKEPNGLFSYFGSRKMLQMIGGRGELSQVINMMEDGDFFHSKYRKKGE